MTGRMRTTLNLVMNPLTYRQIPLSIAISKTVHRVLQLRPDECLDEAVNVCCALKRAQKRGSPFCPTNACSELDENQPADCGKERDPHHDDPN